MCVMNRLCYLIFTFSVFLIISCYGNGNEQEENDFNSLNDVTDVRWEQLSKKNIFFGHHSVGNNILDGIKTLMEENSKIKLDIIHEDELTSDKKGYLLHGKIGKNKDPKSKIDDFKSKVEKYRSKDIKIAFFKMCYVDIISSTNVEAMFLEYKNAMNKMKKKYPNISFVHLTVPLKLTRIPLKLKVKSFIKSRKIVPSIKSNAKRNKYNDLIRKEYMGKEPVFDLAMWESTYPDGKRELFATEDNKYFSLVPDYASDGGHLNSNGKKWIARKLLLFLINL